MPAVSLQANRDRWVDDMCSDVLDAVGEEGANLVDAIRSDEVRPDLTAATFVTWVAAELAGGFSSRVVAGRVLRSGVLDPDLMPMTNVLSLIDRVEGLLFDKGLPIGEPWDVKSGFSLLIEIWAGEHAVVYGEDDMRERAQRQWGVSDPRMLAYLADVDSRPLSEHLTLTETVEADGRELVQAVVAQAFTDERVHVTRELIMDAMNVSGVEHLRALAVDVTSTAVIGDRIRQFGQHAHRAGQHEVAIAAAGADFIMQDARTAVGEALSRLTPYEVSCVALDADWHFQTACLTAFIERNRTTRLHDRLEGRRGTFGPLPWWRVAIDDEHRHHADSCLIDRSPGIRMRYDEGSAALSLHLYDSAGDYFYTFSYQLTSVADAFALLHLGRADCVAMDFEQEFGGDIVRLGSMRVPIPDEIATHLRDVATGALRQHLGFEDGYQDYNAVFAAAEAACLKPSITDIWSRPSSEFNPALDLSASAFS